MTDDASDLSSWEWPRARMLDALHALGRAAGFQAAPSLSSSATESTASSSSAVSVVTAVDSDTPGGDRNTTDWLVDAAAASRLDVEASDVAPARPLAALSAGAPLLLRLAGRSGCLAVLRATPRTVTLVSAHGLIRIPAASLDDALWAPHESPTSGTAVDGTPAAGRERGRRGAAVAGAASRSERRARVAARVLRAPGLIGHPLAEAWMVRPIHATLADSLRGTRLYRRFASIIVAYLVQFALFLAIWKEVGARAFALADTPAHTRASDRAGLGLLLGAWVVVQLAASAAVSRLALDVGAAVRAALIRGAMRLDRDHIRAAGVGQLLGRALEAEGLDSLALGGGVEATAAVFQVALAVVVLALGVSPGLSLSAAAVVLAALAVAAYRHARRLGQWSHVRRALTHDLVERMIGHRTTLIQDRRQRRAAADEEALRGYDGRTRALDHADAWLAVGLPRLSLVLGLGALAPVFLLSPAAGTAVGFAPVVSAATAVSVGGVWLLYGALRRLGEALPMLSLAAEAWRQVTPLIGAVERSPPHGESAPRDHGESAPRENDRGPAPRPGVAVGAVNPSSLGAAAPPAHRGDPVAGAPPLLTADRLSYRYPGRSTLVLDEASLTLAAGDRILLEGVSGGGKSTLAALLTGLKIPSGGVLRLRDEDQRSLGLVRWRRAIAGAPQFHDNHVLGADLLFNLLMGRRWPPRAQDLADAERVCHDLGLRPLLERMPAGLLQLVGETGWQLSHGERSRLFIARSLLQDLDARVLDESFASLDPSTLDEVMTAVLARPQALVVIAHP